VEAQEFATRKQQLLTKLIEAVPEHIQE